MPKEIDERAPLPAIARASGQAGDDDLASVERELAATRAELTHALQRLDVVEREQHAIDEGYQATNLELVTSKEALQCLNEELTLLNDQLQDTLEHQRTTSDDLQNVLYSTDVATLFLDANLNIRFFTPATKSLFRVIPGDIGRPLSDLNSLASDTNLTDDACAVLRGAALIEREIEVPGGVWFDRRVMPYRTRGKDIEGVVITFTDITDDKRTADALVAAKRQAERATVAKSRFLAAASHDLRQPLQSLVLLQGLLAKTVENDAAMHLVARMDHTLGSMSVMLNTLLDIKQIEAGVVRPEFIVFPIEAILSRLEEEFALEARSQKLVLRRVRSSLHVRSDPGLLEQIIRNLIANAIKYTRNGEVLFGCRRQGKFVRIEVWDTGLGIANHELDAIFEEYHQVENVARERSLGLGLGLPIVKRLSNLLGHEVRVRSELGRGSTFLIEVPRSPAAIDRPVRTAALLKAPALLQATALSASEGRTGSILIVEDDAEVRGLLELLMAGEGHDVAATSEALKALDRVEHGVIRPDVVLTDYNLPGGLNGIELAVGIRKSLGWPVPVIVLTGDISTQALRDISSHDCVQLNKPVDVAQLTNLVDSLLASSRAGPVVPSREPCPALGSSSLVYIVDDDPQVREAIGSVVEADGRASLLFQDAESFLEAYRPGESNCLLLDAYLPGMSGFDLLRRLHDLGHSLPTIMITGHSDVAIAVRAMKAGAIDFIEKPVKGSELLACVDRALEQSRDDGQISRRREEATARLEGLTARQHEIMDLVLAGHPSKNIASDLGISQRTVENHRAAIMTRTGSKSLPELARLALMGTSERPTTNIA